eukprot:8875359-Pyramimonas_sp.AAC.1
MGRKVMGRSCPPLLNEKWAACGTDPGCYAQQYPFLLLLLLLLRLPVSYTHLTLPTILLV